MLRTLSPRNFTTTRDHVAYGIDARPAGEERIPAGTELELVGSSIVVQTVILADEGRVVGILADELAADVEAAR